LSDFTEQRPAEAAAEFEAILARGSAAPISVLYPLAELGLARAAAKAEYATLR
jgi:hypothetical protein